ncbi:hypothetical protein [Swingsia samuiensis]|uniref:Uncharacterized protein n=1 Tax=Swingsia samuiensis TaxID=1293412 RepID=A0A4Y6UKS9_9PROT|nr:hypothetical protein [Swingsia samuiensis]QDH17400.1 hypothetical protein E3D00_07355 [Swingsia samuiensis]
MNAYRKNTVTSQDWEKSTLRSEEEEVDLFLESIDASRNQFLLAGHRALHARTDATPLHAKTAKGTFLFQAAIFQVRYLLVGEKWEPSFSKGIEYIENKAKKIRVAYSTVDVCCRKDVLPKPLSKKGPATERSLNNSLFSDLPTYTKSEDTDKKDIFTTYYLLLDDKGNMELSRPIVSNKTFSSYKERNFLGNCNSSTETKMNLEGDILYDFDPQIIKK